jgi:hypothetical protein
MKLEQERKVCRAMVDELEKELRHYRGQYHLIDRDAKPVVEASAILKKARPATQVAVHTSVLDQTSSDCE